MDNTVYNGYTCGLCSRRLASKYSLERHIRLKHKSDLDENDPPTKKSRTGRDEEESSDGDIESNNNKERDTDLDSNSEKISAGSVELDNNGEIDNNNIESEESANSMDTETSNNVNVFKHELFDIVENSKEMCDRFKYCLIFATFRIHPPPVPISCFKMYAKWVDGVFEGILEYFAPKYSPDPEDFVSLTIFHADTKSIIWIEPRKRKELDVTYIVSKIFKEKLTNPSGVLAVGLNCVKSKVTCPSCGHTKVSKDGMSYTDYMS